MINRVAINKIQKKQNYTFTYTSKLHELLSTKKSFKIAKSSENMNNYFIILFNNKIFISSHLIYICNN